MPDFKFIFRATKMYLNTRRYVKYVINNKIKILNSDNINYIFYQIM